MPNFYSERKEISVSGVGMISIPFPTDMTSISIHLLMTDIARNSITDRTLTRGEVRSKEGNFPQFTQKP